MRFWLLYVDEPIAQWPALAQTAEKCGFEGVSLNDHVVIPETFASTHDTAREWVTPTTAFLEPLSMIAALSMITSTLRFMSYVYVLPLRDPFLAAKQIATVALVSDNRLALGVGVGWLREEMELVGRDPATRGRRTDEMLEICRDLWDDGWAEHHGTFYDFERCGMSPVPTRSIPVWVGGRTDAALHRAARNEGWIGMSYEFDELSSILVILQRCREAAGNTEEDFEIVYLPMERPSSDLYRRLEDRGVTSVLTFPQWFAKDSSLQARQSAIRAFADEFIAPFRQTSEVPQNRSKSWN